MQKPMFQTEGGGSGVSNTLSAITSIAAQINPLIALAVGALNSARAIRDAAKAAGVEVSYLCEDHPDQSGAENGTCPTCGKTLVASLPSDQELIGKLLGSSTQLESNASAAREWLKTLPIVAFVLLLASPAFAQNPCTVPQTNAVVTATTNRFVVELAEHNAIEPDGTPRVVAYQYGAWPATVTDPNTVPPAQGPSTIPKTAFVPVAGFPNCYELTGGLPGLIPSQTRHLASIRAQSQAGALQPFSPWSPPSNSFSLASPRVTPAAPGQSRIRQ